MPSSSNTDLTLVWSVGRATIKGIAFECIQFFGLFGLDDIPHACFVLAPSTETGLPSTYPEIYSVMANVSSGDPVTVTFRMSGRSSEAQKTVDETITVFSGNLDGWGPIVFMGMTRILVWARHWLVDLEKYSALSRLVHGRSLFDYGLPPISADKEALTTSTQGSYQPSDVSGDLWKKVIKPELLRLSQNKATILNDNDGSELPLSMTSVESPLDVLLDVRRTLSFVEDDETTLWDKLIRLGARYKFALSPRVKDFSIIPLVYTLGGSPPERQFNQVEFNLMQDFNSYLSEFTQAVESFEGATSYTLPFDIVGKKSRTKSRSSSVNDDPMQSLDEQLQPWVYPWLSLSSRAAETMGLRSNKLLASGYVTGSEENSGQTANQAYNTISGSVAQAYLQAELSTQLYRERTVIIRGPLCFDLSPGSMVVYQDSQSSLDPNDRVHSTYGCVRRMCIALDSSGKGGTWLLASHLRSVTEQTALAWKTHPLYKQRWVRAPLLDVPGLVARAELG
jgi:hypothetical protein